MLKYLTRSTVYASCHPRTTRTFSALAQKSPPEHAHKGSEKNKEDMRDLLINLMNTAPSKRELQQFLKRYVPQAESATPISSLQIPKPASYNLGSPEEYVNSLLSPSVQQLALTKVEGPFERIGWTVVASTLQKLYKLGLSSIVVADNGTWTTQGPPGETCKTMIRESMALIESIERIGFRARPIMSGVLERSESGEIQVNLDYVQTALANSQIPVLIPIATDLEGKQQPIKANDAMVALTSELSRDKKHVPNKIIVINNEGGIPNHERPGTAHSLINVQEEYDAILSAFKSQKSWQQSYPTAVQNLDMIKECLSHLPTTSSAIIAPTSSLPSALIANHVTDKPLYSSSLPIHNATLGSPDLRQVNQLRTTVLRHGIKIHNYSTVDELDLARMTGLLEASFKKKLDEDGFYKRLRQVLAGAIVAGNYEGAVIMTKEPAGSSSHYYLDKFAIAPTSQGIGLTDILWKRMCDAYPELLWRSRKDNGVNKWYFERSNGYLRLKDSNWVLFWCGAGGFDHIQDYAAIANSIPASFTGPLTTR